MFCTFACWRYSRMTKKIFCSKLVKLAQCRCVLSLVAIMAKCIWKCVQRISSPSFIFELLLRAAVVSSLSNQIQKITKKYRNEFGGACSAYLDPHLFLSFCWAEKSGQRYHHWAIKYRGARQRSDLASFFKLVR